MGMLEDNSGTKLFYHSDPDDEIARLKASLKKLFHKHHWQIDGWKPCECGHEGEAIVRLVCSKCGDDKFEYMKEGSVLMVGGCFLSWGTGGHMFTSVDGFDWGVGK